MPVVIFFACLDIEQKSSFLDGHYVVYKRNYGFRSAIDFKSYVAGGMAEWSKAAVLKTVECNSSVGSNPTPSAIFNNG
jgi:hypothetical protein